MTEIPYATVVRRIAAIAAAVVPPGATVAVVSKGDDTLVELDGLVGWHFPGDAAGGYAGYHPASGAAAVEQLEAARARGARYLLLPRTAYWWLDHYPELAAHLDRRCRRVHRDEHCAVYELSRRRLRRPRRAGSIAAGAIHADEVSVVVTSHEKGPWLEETLASVTAQTARPAEVIVVEDASRDATREIAERFGARYERIERRSPALARNHGAELASAPFLCFLDGDDLLPPDFLALHLEALATDPHAGFAYGRVREFGERERLWPAQPWDHDVLRRRNFVPAASVVRASAFRQVTGFPDLDRAEDWGLWLELSRAGWQGVPCPAVWRWRRHGGSRNAARTWDRPPTWSEEAPLPCLRLAIFSALAGRGYLLDEWLDTLRTLSWPRGMTELWLHDDSGDPAFHRALWSAAASLDGFGAIHVVRSHPQGEGPDRVARIYSWAAATVRADLVLFLEDDVIPRSGGRFVEDLVGALDWDVDGVYGWYRSRLGNILVVDPPQPGADWAWRTGFEPHTGVTEAAGGGLGCLLVRSDVLRGRTFEATEPRQGPDVNLSRALWSEGRRLVCNWQVECRHVVGAGLAAARVREGSA